MITIYVMWSRHVTCHPYHAHILHRLSPRDSSEDHIFMRTHHTSSLYIKHLTNLLYRSTRNCPCIRAVRCHGNARATWQTCHVMGFCSPRMINGAGRVCSAYNGLYCASVAGYSTNLPDQFILSFQHVLSRSTNGNPSGSHVIFSHPMRGKNKWPRALPSDRFSRTLPSSVNQEIPA